MNTSSNQQSTVTNQQAHPVPSPSWAELEVLNLAAAHHGGALIKLLAARCIALRFTVAEMCLELKVSRRELGLMAAGHVLPSEVSDEFKARCADFLGVHSFVVEDACSPPTSTQQGPQTPGTNRRTGRNRSSQWFQRSLDKLVLEALNTLADSSDRLHPRSAGRPCFGGDAGGRA